MNILKALPLARARHLLNVGPSSIYTFETIKEDQLEQKLEIIAMKKLKKKIIQEAKINKLFCKEELDFKNAKT